MLIFKQNTRLNYLKNFFDLFEFKKVYDENENEYVLYKSSFHDTILNVKDKTEFESLENHVHLVDHIKKSEFEQLLQIGNGLGKALLCSLKYEYPSKHFRVYVQLQIKGSMIVRFHQVWENEEPYFDEKDLNCATEKILLFEA